MKALVFWLSLVMITAGSYQGHAQKKKKGSYRLWVELVGNEEMVSGKLLKLGDSAIVIRIWESEQVEHIAVGRIRKMKFRRKGAIGKGIGIGVGAGIVVGAIIGQGQGDDTAGFFSLTAEEKSFVNGLGLALVGAPVGAIIGSSRKKFDIDGRQKSYDALKPEMSRYLPNP